MSIGFSPERALSYLYLWYTLSGAGLSGTNQSQYLNLGFCNIYHKDQSLDITNTNAKGNKISDTNTEWGLSLQVRVVGGWLGD